MPRLRRVDCSAPGIRRVRRGRGWSYAHADGSPIDDPEELERIRGLAIPPAWKDVWICLSANGHIQATGYDDAGRKQYLYHQHWREAQDRAKFRRMEEFAESLPSVRERVERDLRKREVVRERALACAVRLLDLGFFRIGGEEYAAGNESFGLATLRKEHLRFERGTAVFDYPAKSGQRRVQKISDTRVLPTLRILKRRRAGSPELLAYRNGRSWVDVRSEDINDYLKLVAGAEYSAKDFRTWNATVLAAVALATEDLPASQTARKRVIREAVERVSTYLGNTPAVCRSAYIDPRVFDRFDSGETIREVIEDLAADAEPGEFVEREQIERAVLDLIR
jgi:DNA topoisomerase I